MGGVCDCGLVMAMYVIVELFWAEYVIVGLLWAGYVTVGWLWAMYVIEYAIVGSHVLTSGTCPPISIRTNEFLRGRK